jgi:hypothetical protein
MALVYIDFYELYIYNKFVCVVLVQEELPRAPVARLSGNCIYITPLHTTRLFSWTDIKMCIYIRWRKSNYVSE